MNGTSASIGNAHVGYVLRSYPRLSQTFILNEILALERLGLDVHLFAMTNPREQLVQEDVAAVRARPHYLELACHRSRSAVFLEHLRLALAAPHRYLATLAYVLRRRDLDTGYVTTSRFCCFTEAVHMAQVLRTKTTRVRHVHSHFAHDPTLIALLVKRLTGLTFSFTAHARDLYQTPARALAERVREATAVVTCCQANVDYLEQIASDASSGKVRLLYYGIDLDAFRPNGGHEAAQELPLIVSVGRLVEKKGFDDLIAACATVKDAGHRFRCVIYGDGPLQEVLARAVASAGLTDSVTLAGACTHAEIRRVLAQADLFALTPVVADDGDRDGIPNALLEAMASGLPVVSTAVAGIPEAVIHDETGLLAQASDVAAIAGHLIALLTDEERRRRFGSQARQACTEHFDRERNARQLASLLVGKG
jgi:glycosyltransferase involved in cell wall biosynthesis